MCPFLSVVGGQGARGAPTLEPMHPFSSVAGREGNQGAPTPGPIALVACLPDGLGTPLVTLPYPSVAPSSSLVTPRCGAEGQELSLTLACQAVTLSGTSAGALCAWGRLISICPQSALILCLEVQHFFAYGYGGQS